MDAVTFPHGSRCCAFAEHGEEAHMAQTSMGTVDPETLEVSKGIS